MKIFDFIFGNTYSDIIFLIIEFGLVGLTYSWWKKEHHKDHLWLLISWAVVLGIKLISYLFKIFLLPAVASTSYLETFFWFSTLRGAITDTAFFYLIAVLFIKWSLPSTPRKTSVFRHLMSPWGLFMTFTIALGLNAAIFGYLAQILL